MTTVRSNRHWHNFAARNEVPATVLADQFDHLEADEANDGFFMYRGYWYHTSDFMACPPVTQQRADPFNGWHGYHADSYFSGTLIKMSRDGEQYQVGTYVS